MFSTFFIITFFDIKIGQEWGEKGQKREKSKRKGAGSDWLLAPRWCDSFAVFFVGQRTVPCPRARKICRARGRERAKSTARGVDWLLAL